jgi:hypothetical protein
MTDEIWILGAEKQAAVSLALAYPERHFVFIADHPVLDGWDLPNVRFEARATGSTFGPGPPRRSIVLCPRWLNKEALARWRLTALMPRIAAALDGLAVPAFIQPGSAGEWQVKGDAWHRPDAILRGSAEELYGIQDPHGSGLAFQPRVEAKGSVQIVGHRASSGLIAAAAIEVLGETFCREALLTAGQTVELGDMLGPTQAALAMLDHSGLFTASWLRSAEGPRLVALRPTAPAVFQTLRLAGVDLLEPPTGQVTASPGVRFIADYHYSSYRELR